MVKRVVFDTNVLISGYLWNGPARKALEKARAGEITLLISRSTVKELIRVLAYEKFGLTPMEIQPIVSGDHHLLDIKTFKGIPIMGIRKFLIL